ncbi:hypothetical protein ScPMuIL_012111 [Solemya velum]
MVILAGLVKRLDEFTYADGDINDLITESFYGVNFIGVKSDISFDRTGTLITQGNVRQLQDNEMTLVGIFDPTADGGTYEWINGGIKWPGGNVPRDSTMVIEVKRNMGTEIYAILSSLAVLGILISCGFLTFNVLYRKTREVKMSSPNINSVLLVGCMITYSTVLLQSSESLIGNTLCKVRIIWFTVGFSLVFGSLFSKTWRVYKIFSNKQTQNLRIKDSQLLMIIAILLVIDCTIVVTWEIIDPQRIVSFHLPPEVSVDDEDIAIHPYVLVCVSDYSMYLKLTLYIKQGMLLVFGAFLAWETRTVKMEALNDSRQIGMCLYNIVVLSALGVVISLVLNSQVDLYYGLISGCIVGGTALTQMIIFIPKILHIRQQRVIAAEISTMQSVSNSKNTMHSVGGSVH